MPDKQAKPCVLITGITGFLGSRLAQTLVAEGYAVIGLKRRSSSFARIEKILPVVTLYDADDLDCAQIFCEHQNIETVIHTAACYGRHGESDFQVFLANTTLALQILEATISAGVRAFVNCDTSLDKYVNAYSLSKRQFSEWGRFLGECGKITFFNIHLEHFFGPGDDNSKFTTYIIKSCLDNVPEIKLTKGEQLRDFIFIDDVASAFTVLLANISKFTNSFVEFDLGSGKAITIKEFVQLVREIHGSQTDLNFGAVPYRQDEAMFTQADLSFWHKLGWQPLYSLRQGLEQTM